MDTREGEGAELEEPQMSESSGSLHQEHWVNKSDWVVDCTFVVEVDVFSETREAVLRERRNVELESGIEIGDSRRHQVFVAKESLNLGLEGEGSQDVALGEVVSSSVEKKVLESPFPDLRVVQVDCDDIVSFPKVVDEVGGVESRASWNWEMSAEDSLLELSVLRSIPKVRTQVRREIDLTELTEIRLIDSLKQELDVRDCQTVAWQIQTSELSEVVKLGAECLEEGSWLILVDDTLGKIQRLEGVLRGNDLEDLFEFIDAELIGFERERGEGSREKELGKSCFDRLLSW